MSIVVERLSSEVPCVVRDLCPLLRLDGPGQDVYTVSDVFSLRAGCPLVGAHERPQQTREVLTALVNLT